MYLILVLEGLADEMVEEVGVLLLGLQVARVQQDGQPERLEVLQVLGPVRVVELHRARVVRVVGHGQDLRGQEVLLLGLLARVGGRGVGVGVLLDLLLEDEELLRVRGRPGEDALLVRGAEGRDRAQGVDDVLRSEIEALLGFLVCQMITLVSWTSKDIRRGPRMPRKISASFFATTPGGSSSFPARPMSPRTGPHSPDYGS